MSETKLLGTFPGARVFADHLEVNGEAIAFSELQDIRGSGSYVTFSFRSGASSMLRIDSDEGLIDSASNLRIMAWRAFLAWKKDHNAGSHGVIGY
jgi:hypothetical protein